MSSSELIDSTLDVCRDIAAEIQHYVSGLPFDERERRVQEPGIDNCYEIDKYADSVVHEALRDFPGYVLTEEQPVDKTRLTDQWIIVIDPIDGTSNAARDLGYWCFSAAILYEGKVCGAIVVDQTRDRTFIATEHSSVLLEGNGRARALRPPDVTQYDLSTSLVCFHGYEGPPVPFRHNRHMGASALSICDVAAGSLDIYLDDEGIFLKPWDILAGEYIARMAGCFVSRRDSQGLFAATGMLVARTNEHAELVRDIFPHFFEINLT